MVSPLPRSSGASMVSAIRAAGETAVRSCNPSGNRTAPSASDRPSAAISSRTSPATRVASTVPARVPSAADDSIQPTGSAISRERLRRRGRPPATDSASPRYCSGPPSAGSCGSTIESSSALAIVLTVTRGSSRPSCVARSVGTGKSCTASSGVAQTPSLKSSAMVHASGVPLVAARQVNPVVMPTGCRRSATVAVPARRSMSMRPPSVNAPPTVNAEPSSISSEMRPSASTRSRSPPPSATSATGIVRSLTPRMARSSPSRSLRRVASRTSGSTCVRMKAAGDAHSASTASSRGAEPRAAVSNSPMPRSSARNARQAGVSPADSNSRRVRSVVESAKAARSRSSSTVRRPASASTSASTRCP